VVPQSNIMQEYCITQSSFNVFPVLRKRTAGQSKNYQSILVVLRTMLTNGSRSTEQWVSLLGWDGGTLVEEDQG
jgi:hypothetical protein